MISIIVPVYNVEPFIQDCLDSIRDQTFRDWECILVNDGSTDGSGRVCRKYCKRDPRFKYIYQKNAGVSAARNAGLDAAQGEFISFVDPDDFINNDFLSTMMESLCKYSADIVSCYGISVSESDSYLKWRKAVNFFADRCKIFNRFTGMEISFPPPLREDVIEGRDDIAMALVNEQIGTVCWDKLYKRSLWQETRFPENITLGEDAAIIPEIVTKADIFVQQPKAIYFYRRRSSSLSNFNVTPSRFKQTIDARKRAAEYLVKTVPGEENRVSDWELRQNITDLIGYSLKREHKGSILAKICEQAPLIEQYQGMDKFQTAKTVLRDAYRFMKGSEES